jgi:hypothetical protein
MHNINTIPNRFFFKSKKIVNTIITTNNSENFHPNEYGSYSPNPNAMG